jgi:hypothetical protein
MAEPVEITDVFATTQSVIVCLLRPLENKAEMGDWDNVGHYTLVRLPEGTDEIPVKSILYVKTIPGIVLQLGTLLSQGDDLRMTYRNPNGQEKIFETEVGDGRSSEPVEEPDPGTEPDEVLQRVRNIDANIARAAEILSVVDFSSFEAIPGQLTDLEELVLSVKEIIAQPVNPSLQAIKDDLLQAKEDVQDSSPEIEDEEEENEAEWKQTLVTNQIALWDGLLPKIQEALKSQDIRTDMQAKLRLLQSDVNASLSFFYGHRNGIPFFTWQHLRTEALGRINTALTRTN